MPMWGDLGLRKVFPSLELTTATCGVEHRKRQMRHMMRLQARIRQMESEPRHQCFVEGGLGRRIPETHDSLAWLVTHAAATINWFRPGLDGKTPYELRVGRKFRRPVAPWRQKVWLVSAKKHVSRVSAESRWQEGIFLGIFGAANWLDDIHE